MELIGDREILRYCIDDPTPMGRDERLIALDFPFIGEFRANCKIGTVRRLVRRGIYNCQLSRFRGRFARVANRRFSNCTRGVCSPFAAIIPWSRPTIWANRFPIKIHGSYSSASRGLAVCLRTPSGLRWPNRRRWFHLTQPASGDLAARGNAWWGDSVA